MRIRRTTAKGKIQRVCENPETGAVLKSFNRNVFGKPRLEVDQSDLLATILKNCFEYVN